MAGRLLRVAGLAVAGIALVLLVGLPFPAVLDAALRAVVLASLAALGVAGLVVSILRPRHGWYLAGAGALIAATCASALTSAIPSAAGAAVLLSASLAGIGLLALEWTRSERGRTDAVVVIGVGVTALVAGTYLASCLGVWLDWTRLGMPPAALPLRPAGVGGLVPGPIWTTDYLVLTTPVGVAYLWRAGGAGRVAALVLGAAAVLAVMLAAVRAVWVAEAAILIVLVALTVRHGAWSPRMKAFAAGGAAVVLVGAGALLVTGRLDTQLRSIDEGRSTAIAAAVAIGAEHPITGAGPGTYGSLRLAEPAESINHLALPDAHDLPAQVFAEMGSVGLLALVVAAAGFAWAWFRRRSTRDGIATAAVVGLASVLAHRMADMVFIIPGIAVCALVVGAIALGPADEETRAGDAPGSAAWHPGRVAQRLVAAAILAALVVSIPPAVTRMTAEAAYRDASAALDGGHATEAAMRADEALAAAPDLVPALIVRSVARALAGSQEAAIDDARTALEREPMNHARLRLAVLLHGSGRTDEALDVYREILATTPPELAPLLNAASAFTEAGDTERARAAVRALVAIEPGLVRVADDLPPAVADLVRAEARTARAGRPADARSLGEIQATAWLDGLDATAALPVGSADPALSAVAAALDGTDASWSRLDALAKDRPALASAAWWVAMETCREQDAARWSRVVEIQTGTAPELPTSAGRVPAASGDLEPNRYPDWIWGVPSPRTPYPPGTWLVEEGGSGRCSSR